MKEHGSTPSENYPHVYRWPSTSLHIICTSTLSIEAIHVVLLLLSILNGSFIFRASLVYRTLVFCSALHYGKLWLNAWSNRTQVLNFCFHKQTPFLLGYWKDYAVTYFDFSCSFFTHNSVSRKFAWSVVNKDTNVFQSKRVRDAYNLL